MPLVAPGQPGLTFRAYFGVVWVFPSWFLRLQARPLVPFAGPKPSLGLYTPHSSFRYRCKGFVCVSRLASCVCGSLSSLRTLRAAGAFLLRSRSPLPWTAGK